jgi:acetylornithine deacetylase/succinyl-diaminopimelate desuccinylase-like protein
MVDAAIAAAVERHWPQAWRSLTDILAIPSVSAQGRGMEEAARYLHAFLSEMGAAVHLVATDGFPAVVGSLPGTPGAPSLLLYGHYDVQPEDPLALWHSPPFTPTVRDGVLYARGATDDKGNIMAALWGIRVAAALGLPRPHLRFCLEGEEEIGSPHLAQVLDACRHELAADACVLCDRGIHASGAAQIFLGNKGMVSVEITVTGAARDVHSSQAPLLPNAARQLVEIVARISSPAGEPRIPALLGDRRPPTPAERELLRRLPFARDAYAADYGLQAAQLLPPTDADRLAVLERLLFQPTANLQGFHAGYGGPGHKTIVPARATAKLDVRLVPDMERHRAAAAVREAVVAAARAAGVAEGALTVEVGADMDPYTAPVDHPAVQAAIAAGRRAYPGEPVVWPLVDGSGPLAAFARAIGGPAFLIGLGNPFERANTHAPDEKLDLDTFRRGIAMMATFLSGYAGGGQAGDHDAD